MDEINSVTEAPKPGTKDALKAELEALKAENEALKAAAVQGSTTAEATPAAPAKVQMEEIFIPRGYANDEPNLFVSVNGSNYLLPKGKKSTVPAFVAREIRRSWKAQEKMDEHIDQMLEASK